MEIVETIKDKELTDYAFMFQSGAKLAITIDAEAGDTFQEAADRFLITIASKPSLTDPEEKTDAEALCIFKSGLAAINIVNRIQRQHTEEELFDMRQTIKALSKTIQ